MPQTLTAEDRACLEYAIRSVLGFDYIFVMPDGRFVIHPTEVSQIDPSQYSSDAVIATLSQMMKLYVKGASLGQLRDDLLRSNVGEKFANRVHDHIEGISSDEWAALRSRIRWYSNDMGGMVSYASALEGDT